MKLRSLRYLTAEGFKNVWVNRLMSVASVGVLAACMLMMGVAIIASLNLDKAMSQLEAQNVAMVYFNDDLSEDSAREVCTKISGMDNIASAVFITKQEALEAQINNMDSAQAQYFLDMYKDDNPMPDGARVTLTDLSQFEQTVDRIVDVDGVMKVNEQRELAARITSIGDAVTLIGIGIISLLVIISLVIVANTVRITMYNRKLEISIMKAVGATNSFIRFPFVVEGVLLGILSAGLTMALVYGLYKVAARTIVEQFGSALIPFGEMGWTLFGIFLIMGVATGLVSSFMMISRYLKKEGSEFRAL